MAVAEGGLSGSPDDLASHELQTSARERAVDADGEVDGNIRVGGIGDVLRLAYRAHSGRLITLTSFVVPRSPSCVERCTASAFERVVRNAFGTLLPSTPLHHRDMGRKRVRIQIRT